MADQPTTEPLSPLVFEVRTHREADGSYWVEAPGMPGLVTQGETLEELTRNLQEALEGWLLTDDPDMAARLGISPTPPLELSEEAPTLLTFADGRLRNAA